MGCVYVLAGANHFISPTFYLAIMPPWLPWHLALVYLSGVAEIVCGLLLLVNKTRRLGGWLTIALLVAIYPANIQMLLDFYHQHNPALWVAVVRLPLQVLFIYWAWLCTNKGTIAKQVG